MSSTESSAQVIKQTQQSADGKLYVQNKHSRFKYVNLLKALSFPKKLERFWDPMIPNIDHRSRAARASQQGTAAADAGGFQGDFVLTSMLTFSKSSCVCPASVLMHRP